MWPARAGPGPTRENIELFGEYCEAAEVRRLWPRAGLRPGITTLHNGASRSRSQCQLRLGASCELVSAPATP